jgi:transcriptional regulator with XRE-family HTH domain
MPKPNARKPVFSPLTMNGDRLTETLFAECRRRNMTLKQIGEAAGLTGSTLNTLLRERHVVPKYDTIRRLASAIGARIAIITEDGQTVDPYGPKQQQGSTAGTDD